MNKNIVFALLTLSFALAGCSGGIGVGAVGSDADSCVTDCGPPPPRSTTQFEKTVVSALSGYLAADTRSNQTVAPNRSEVIYSTDRVNLTTNKYTWDDLATNGMAAFVPVTLTGTALIPAANECPNVTANGNSFYNSANIAYAYSVDHIRVYLHKNLEISSAEVAKRVTKASIAAWSTMQNNYGYPSETAFANQVLSICIETIDNPDNDSNSAPGPHSIVVRAHWDNSDAGLNDSIRDVYNLVAHEGAHLVGAYANNNPPSGPALYARHAPAWIDEGASMFMGNQPRYGTKAQWDDWLAKQTSAGRAAPADVPASGSIGGILVTQYGYHEAFNAMFMDLFNNPNLPDNKPTRYLTILRKMASLRAQSPVPCTVHAPYGNTELCFVEAFDAEKLSDPNGGSAPLTFDAYRANYRTFLPAHENSAAHFKVTAQQTTAGLIPSSPLPPPIGDKTDQVKFDAVVLAQAATTLDEIRKYPTIYDADAQADGTGQIRSELLPAGEYSIGIETVDSSGAPLQLCIKKFTLNAKHSTDLVFDVGTADQCISAN